MSHPIGEYSANNPGWYGKGVPSLHLLLVSRVCYMARSVKNGEIASSRNLLRATISDLWNFYGIGRLSRRVECPCCGWKGPAFVASSNWRTPTFQSICPQCDSRSRHRGLMEIIPNIIHHHRGRILFFAPEGILLRRLETLGAKYRLDTTDLRKQDVTFPGEDIQRLSFREESYSIIICNHVLEHVFDDKAALMELSRILTPNGIALITVPGDFDKETTRCFEQPDSNGHYRHYGMEIVAQMKQHFHQVEAIDMSTIAQKRWKVRQLDYVFLCTK